MIVRDGLPCLCPPGRWLRPARPDRGPGRLVLPAAPRPPPFDPARRVPSAAACSAGRSSSTWSSQPRLLADRRPRPQPFERALARVPATATPCSSTPARRPTCVALTALTSPQARRPAAAAGRRGHHRRRRLSHDGRPDRPERPRAGLRRRRRCRPTTSTSRSSRRPSRRARARSCWPTRSATRSTWTPSPSSARRHDLG